MPQQRNLLKLYSNAGETKTPEEVKIDGKVPGYVNGTYLKVGPGKYTFEDGFSVNHFFDGYSSVAQFEIKNGNQVKFQKKYLETDVFRRANAAQKPVVCEFGTGAFPDPNKGWISRCLPQVIPEMSDNHNMTLYQIGTNVCVAGESCFFRDLNQKTLQLGDRHDTNKCYGLNFVSPHLLTDETGTTYTIGSSFITGLKYNFVKIPPMSGKPTTKEILKKAQVFSSISSQVTTLCSMHHSFGLTSRFLVFVEEPYVLNVTKILGGVLTKGQCFLDWLEWKGDLSNKFYLIDKKTGKIHKTEVFSDSNFMFTHFINCYEEKGHVIVDLLRFDNGDFFEANCLKNVLSNPPPKDSVYAKAVRFVIPLIENINEIPENINIVSLPHTSATAIRRGKKLIITYEQLTNKGLELPCLNKSFIGKKYKYFYCTGNTSPEGYYENSLIKKDLEAKTIKVWQGTPTCFPGEPVFIPNPCANEDEEDSGVVLSIVVNSEESSNDYVLFLDAKTFTEIGRAKLTEKIPFLIHGLYVPS